MGNPAKKGLKVENQWDYGLIVREVVTVKDDVTETNSSDYLFTAATTSGSVSLRVGSVLNGSRIPPRCSNLGCC